MYGKINVQVICTWFTLEISPMVTVYNVSCLFRARCRESEPWQRPSYSQKVTTRDPETRSYTKPAGCCSLSQPYARLIALAAGGCVVFSTQTHICLITVGRKANKHISRMRQTIHFMNCLKLILNMKQWQQQHITWCVLPYRRGRHVQLQ